MSYLRCIKSHRGSNDPECRELSKSYLSCRMDRYVDHSTDPLATPLSYSEQGYSEHITYLHRDNRNLMAPDSFKNLGFGDDSDSRDPVPATQTSQPQNQGRPRAS